MYKLLKRWDVNEETGRECLGVFKKIRKARQAMHKDVREVEEMNCYQSPDYDGEESRRVSRNRHFYIISYVDGEHIEWEIVRGTDFTNQMYDF